MAAPPSSIWRARPSHRYLQLPTRVSDHESSVPVSAIARSAILSFQVPASDWPLNAAIAILSSERLLTLPPWRPLTVNSVPVGEISVTTRSPRNGWVMLSDSDSEAMSPVPTTGSDDVMPSGSSSGIAIGRLVALTVVLRPRVNAATRVCQLNAPLLASYSCVYQNVQS